MVAFSCHFYYGMCLLKCEDVARDIASAARYSKLAADQGNAEAQNNCGICLLEGRGFAKDVTAAARYFKLLADQ